MALEQLVDTGSPGETLPAAVPSIPDLSSVRGYSATDVIYNRMGSISPDQKALLHRKFAGDLIGLMISGAIPMAFVVAGNLFGVVFLAFLGWFGLKLVRDCLEVWRGAVYQVDGDVTTRLVPDSDGPDSYYLYIDVMKLEMTKEAYGVFRDGGPYRVYYLWDAKRAVGAEVLPGWRR